VAGFQVVPPLVDTSMLATARLSAAVPLIVNGFAEALLITAPFEGTVITEDGGVTSTVVYENE
jgi:hypothetical protein